MLEIAICDDEEDNLKHEIHMVRKVLGYIL